MVYQNPYFILFGTSQFFIGINQSNLLFDQIFILAISDGFLCVCKDTTVSIRMFSSRSC